MRYSIFVFNLTMFFFLLACSKKETNEDLGYVGKRMFNSKTLGIEIICSNSFDIQTTENRIVILDTVHLDDVFKTNAIISVFSNVKEEDYPRLLNDVDFEIRSLGEDMLIKKDSIRYTEFKTQSIGYKFYRDGVNLLGFAKVSFIPKSDKIISVNVMLESKNFDRDKHLVKDILENVHILN